MKKTGLFKIIMFVLLGILVVTWIFSAGYFNEGEFVDLGMYNIGFFDYFQLLFGSFEFSYFIQILILLVSIGALYGVLGKTGKYRALVERIANNFKGAELIFLFVVSFIIAALSAVFDYGFATFIFFPLLISIILTMGYDKITACLATFGALLIGTIGNILGYNTTGVINGLTGAPISTGIYYKLGMFVFSLGALFFFLTRAKKDRKSKNAEEDMFIGEKQSNKYSVVPIIVVLSVLFVLLVLGCTSWEGTFNISLFSDFNTTVSELTVKFPYFHITADGIKYGMEDIAIFGKILGTVTAFGEWYYAEMAVMCLIASLVIGLCYKVKTFEAMAEGAKKMLRPAMLIMLIYSIIYFTGNTMFFPTIAELLLGITKKFNLFFGTIVMIIASALHVDILYVANYSIAQLAAAGASNTILSILGQGIYGVTMFITPTSAVLALGLSYLGISYKEWVKSTWKFILVLFAIVIIAAILAMII